MKKLLFVICAVFIFSGAFAQKITIYHTFASEFIFSYGIVKDNNTGNHYPSALRFSGFFNEQYQLHFNFSSKVGLYTGLGIRNVGLITHPNDSSIATKLKQRAYGIGVPLAFKIGNMNRRSYVYAGAEAEYFFNYKQKYFIDGSKTKSNQWFSDKVTPFNPSVFVGYQHKGFFVVAKYYLLNFLKPSNDLMLNKTVTIPGYSESSQLFYLGIGINLKAGSHKHKNTVVPAKKPARNSGYY